MLWRWVAVLGVVSGVWLSAAQGQQQRQSGAPTATESRDSEISTRATDTAIKVQVNLVLVRVVVREADRKLVAGLRQEDFEVFDNGKRHGISTFSVETGETQGKVAETETGGNAEGEAGAGVVVNAPAKPHRFVALVFDDLHMQAAHAMAVRAA